MKQLEQANLFLRKAAQDESLLDEAGDSVKVDEVFGFHCQQAAEKLLRALLSAAGGTFRKTHDLAVLLNSLSEAGVQLPTEFEAIDALTPFGSVYRYEDLDSMAVFDRRAARNLLKNGASNTSNRYVSIAHGDNVIDSPAALRIEISGQLSIFRHRDCLPDGDHLESIWTLLRVTLRLKDKNRRKE
jgi:HEPN domain-containing protein